MIYYPQQEKLHNFGTALSKDGFLLVAADIYTQNSFKVTLILYSVVRKYLLENGI